MSSRNLTIVGVIEQFKLLLIGKSRVVIHVVGSDDKETPTQANVHDDLQNLIEYSESIGVEYLNVLFVGPDIHTVPSEVITHQAKAVFVEVNILPGFYHDLSGVSTPDFVFMFNAGLWGYDSWNPTFEKYVQLSQQNSNLIFCVTSYAADEGEDDYEAIMEQVVKSGGRVQWYWEDSLNPHRSSVGIHRATGTPGIVYYENYSWMCFSIVQ